MSDQKDRQEHITDGSKAPPYSIGSGLWPGLSKLIEECGEVIQVAGKIIATGGEVEHWDGTNLRERLIDELGDVNAAIGFVIHRCDLDSDRLFHRIDDKYALFEQWHAEQGGAV